MTEQRTQIRVNIPEGYEQTAFNSIRLRDYVSVQTGHLTGGTNRDCEGMVKTVGVEVEGENKGKRFIEIHVNEDKQISGLQAGATRKYYEDQPNTYFCVKR